MVGQVLNEVLDDEGGVIVNFDITPSDQNSEHLVLKRQFEKTQKIETPLTIEAGDRLRMVEEFDTNDWD